MEISNKKLDLFQSLIPLFLLISLLFYNIYFYENNDWLGDYTYHFILLISSLVAFFLGLKNQIKMRDIFIKILENIKSIASAIIILLLVGALAGTWKVSGVIPSMVYYGLNIMNPKVFLPLTLIVSTLVSLTTGCSYTTSATIGIALVAVGIAFNIPAEITAGAVISGAYFGDKMSPLSDTTNLAPAMAGTDLYSHIKYMMYTTIPTYIITFIFFYIISVNIDITLT